MSILEVSVGPQTVDTNFCIIIIVVTHVSMKQHPRNSERKKPNLRASRSLIVLQHARCVTRNMLRWQLFIAQTGC